MQRRLVGLFGALTDLLSDPDPDSGSIRHHHNTTALILTRFPQQAGSEEGNAAALKCSSCSCAPPLLITITACNTVIWQGHNLDFCRQQRTYLLKKKVFALEDGIGATPAHECDGREQQSGSAIRPRAKRILLTAEQSRKHHYAQLGCKDTQQQSKTEKLFAASVCRHIHFND